MLNGMFEDCIKVLFDCVTFAGSTLKFNGTPYLERAPPSFDPDPVICWRTHKEEFQHLAKIVPSYLHAPATSIDCERLFRTSKSWTHKETTRYGRIEDSESEDSDSEEKDDVELDEEQDLKPDLDPVPDDFSYIY
ncbi:hypothetical protein Y032_0408g917 [Ancylostoma ceylanicum]|uniref:HAT C-terminal dimerisation domain-containing protein n=1 Tax=Ancylostoma ceylanicum TaxID=53326 RepID=A0A016X3I4_9BILA|nr:hypothetical protein Y032_0408g917 [Ancylostoma ceylanicum]